MKLKKMLGAGIVVAAIMVVTSMSAGAADPVKIRIASWDPPLVLTMDKTNGNFASSNSKAQMFKSVVEKRSGGRIQVTILPNGQIGGDKDAFEMMQSGALDMSTYPGSILGNFVPECLTYQIPYLFRDHTVANEVMDGPFGDELRALVLKKTGVRILRWGTETFMNYMTSGVPIKVPADLKGKKIRTRAMPNDIEMTNILGASSTPIPYGELYMALQQGVVDGALTLIPTVEMFKLDQGLKYICDADIVYLVGVIAASEKFWQKLSPLDRELVTDAALQASAFHRAMMLYGTNLFGESLAKKGVTIYTATDEDRALWKKAVQEPMIQWTRKKIGDAWVDKVLKAVADEEKRLAQ